jgi:sulfite reductase (ferredoxin)
VGAFDEVREFARQGRASVLPEWASYLFQVVGHLHPGRRRGRDRRQGRRGPGLRLLHDAHRHSQRHRLRRKLRVIGGLARKYARNLADITVRQAIQLHWLTIESLPEVVDALDAIGLSPKGACGDVVRNVTGCRWPAWPPMS